MALQHTTAALISERHSEHRIASTGEPEITETE